MSAPENVPDDVLKRIQSLMNLAAKNTSEGEAASAAAKAQELLERYNLTAEHVEGKSLGSGAREQVAVEGGFYRFQRMMWESVANLNFCLYWVGYKQRGNEYRFTRCHMLVGRRVNVAATRVMATYLQGVVDRLTVDRLGDSGERLYGNWANSYKLGVSSRVCQKLRERRSEVLAAEAARRAAEERASDNASTSTALTLSVYIDRETDANFDFVYGEGWSAKRAAAAARQRAWRASYTKWAAANPEAAAEAEARRRETRGGRSRGSSSTDRIDRSAYWSGYDDGANVSIDPQVDKTTSAGRIGHG